MLAFPAPRHDDEARRTPIHRGMALPDPVTFVAKTLAVASPWLGRPPPCPSGGPCRRVRWRAHIILLSEAKEGPKGSGTIAPTAHRRQTLVSDPRRSRSLSYKLAGDGSISTSCIADAERFHQLFGSSEHSVLLARQQTPSHDLRPVMHAASSRTCREQKACQAVLYQGIWCSVARSL